MIPNGEKPTAIYSLKAHELVPCFSVALSEAYELEFIHERLHFDNLTELLYDPGCFIEQAF